MQKLSEETLSQATAQLETVSHELGRLRQDREILLEISGTMDIKVLLEQLATKLLRVECVDGVVMTILDRAAENLVTLYQRFPDEFRRLESTFHYYKYPLDTPGQHVNAFLQLRTRTLDSQTCNDEERLALDRWKLRQTVVLPLAIEGKAFGTLMLLCQGEPLSGDLHTQILDLVDLFRLPLWHARIYDHLQEQRRAFEAAASEQERFLHFIAEVNELTLPDQIYDSFSHELMSRFSFDLGAVLIENEGVLECRRAVAHTEKLAPEAQLMFDIAQKDPYVVDIQDGGPPHAFVKNIPLVFPDVQEIMHLELPRKSRVVLEAIPGVRTLVNMPIRAKGQPIGVLLLCSLGEVVNLSESDLKFFELLSSFFGSAITNANTFSLAKEQQREIGRLNELLREKISELADEVATDKLTGLANFRNFEQELGRRVNEYRRTTENQGLSIVMADIDHFKKFNDTYGHAAGNVVLAGVGREVAKLSRKMDMACRYGGEEFVVILPKCEEKGALIFAERLRVAVESASFVIESGEKLSVTISVGVATFQEGDSQEAFFERADQALYRAKHAGRNRISS